MAESEWVWTCERGIAIAAKGLLEDVAAELDLLKKPIIVSAYPHMPWIGIGQEERARKARMDVASMLVRRGVLRRADEFYAPNSYTYTGPTEGIHIEAEEQVVRDTIRLLRKRLSGQARTATPTASRPPLPAVPEPRATRQASNDPIDYEVRKTHRVERARLPYAILVAVAAFVIIAALSGGWRWVTRKLGSAFSGNTIPAAAESTGTRNAPAPAKARQPATAESTGTGVDPDAWMGG